MTTQLQLINIIIIIIIIIITTIYMHLPLIAKCHLIPTEL